MTINYLFLQASHCDDMNGVCQSENYAGSYDCLRVDRAACGYGCVCCFRKLLLYSRL